jgi:hypothetical protein
MTGRAAAPTAYRWGVAAGDRIPIACTLEPGDVADRLGEWRALVAHVVGRSELPGGHRLVLGPGVDAGALATLAASERACCAFLDFAITIDARGVALEVTATAEGRPVLDELLAGAGAPSAGADPADAVSR